MTAMLPVRRGPQFKGKMHWRTGSWPCRNKTRNESYLILMQFRGLQRRDRGHRPSYDGKRRPRRFAEDYSTIQGSNGIMGDTKAKLRLAERAFPLMTQPDS